MKKSTQKNAFQWKWKFSAFKMLFVGRHWEWHGGVKEWKWNINKWKSACNGHQSKVYGHDKSLTLSLAWIKEFMEISK